MAPENNNNNHMGFKEWTARFEKEQEEDRKRHHQLADVVTKLSVDLGQLSSDVRTLVDNQKGMFNRINRPWQWGVVVAAFVALFTVSGVFATVLNLTISPINASLAEVNAEAKSNRTNQMEINMWLRDSIENIRVDNAEFDARVVHLEKMEERLNNRLHQRYGIE